MSKVLHPNTLRMLPDTFKTSFHAAVSTLIFEDNTGRVWRVTIDTRFELIPKTEIQDITDYVPADWRDLTADQIGSYMAGKFMDFLAQVLREDEGNQ